MNSAGLAFVYGKDTLPGFLSRLEEHMISQALKYANGSELKAAKLLGITKDALADKRRLYGLTGKGKVLS